MEPQSFYFHKGVFDLKKVWMFFKQVFGEFMSAGGCEVIIKKYRKNKTDQQRKYAHACIGVIAKHCGDDPKHLKVRIKHSLGLIEEIWSDGKVISVEKSTEDLSRDEYGVFIETIKTLGLNLDIQLPEPRNFGMEL